MKKYDLVVIGSGPAGEKTALQAAYFGAKVCVIDRGPVGGAWVNTGTIPSKTLRESARYFSGGRRRGVVTEPSTTPTIHSFMSMKRHLVARWREKVEQNFRTHGVARLRGSASFISGNTLELENGNRVSARHIMIATGSRPRSMPELPVDGERVHDSDSLLTLEHIPHSMVVLGGGVIACEYASIFQALGVQVTLLNGRDRLLGFIDADASQFLEKALIQDGMVIRHNARAEGIANINRGEVEVYLDDGTLAESEMVLVALGREPVLDGLNLDAVDIKLTDWGTIEVNANMQSSNPDIYAAGDVVGFPSLASAGMEQGRAAAFHMFKQTRDPVDDLIPGGIFTIPEVSSVGMSEEEAQKQGFDPVTGIADYSENVRAPMIGDERGMVKLIADRKSKKLLGATIIGNQATELIHFALAVIKYGGTLDDLIHFVFNLPTLSALYRQASYNALHKINQDET